jgi:hypothetical protein
VSVTQRIGGSAHRWFGSSVVRQIRDASETTMSGNQTINLDRQLSEQWTPSAFLANESCNSENMDATLTDPRGNNDNARKSTF